MTGSVPARSGHRHFAPFLVLGSIAVVALLAVGAVGTGVFRLPGMTGSTTPGAASSAADPVESPPAIDNLATPATGTLTFGADATVIATLPLTGDAASVTVTAPGKAWDGLVMTVPAGAWPGATLKVSAQPIEGSTFGDLVTPISPLISVAGAEGMAPQPVTLKIPVTIPADSFAMGFFYDGSGRLEGMPLLAEDGASVTVATEHFSSGFISAVKWSLLPTKIDSGFRPGKDDWQFPNYGSYISPTGNCTGQVLTEAWYYIERRMKDGAGSLYGLFDNNGEEATPTLWQDDSDGYRLASVAQKQYMDRYHGDQNSLAHFFVGWRTSGFESLQYNAFRYAIAVTAEPQIMLIWDTQYESGHSILVYRVTPGEIIVADPNFPAAWKRVPYDAATGKLGPYLSALSRKEVESGNPKTYVVFVYAAKSAMNDWPSLTADWAAFDAGTIGDGIFPAITLRIVGDSGWVPLVDGYRTTNEYVMLGMEDQVQAPSWVSLDIYHGTGNNEVSKDARGRQFQLLEGDNHLGFFVREGDNSKFIDFVRLNIIYAPTATTSGGPGRWAQTATTPAGGSNATSYSKEGEKMTIESSSGRVSVSYNYDGPPHRNEVSSFSWTPPPGSAATGDVWISDLSAQGTCSFDIDEQGWGGSVSWIAIWTDGGVKSTKMSESAGVDCQHASGSLQTSWTFPIHDEFSGDTLEITVSAGDSNGSDDWTYTYTWAQP